jgi:cytochrome P450
VTVSTHASTSLALSDLDLPSLAIEEPWFAEDPVSQFIEARRHHPWLARCSVGYLVTEHKAMFEMLRNDACMAFGFNEIVDYMGASGTPWAEFIAGTIQVQTGETHKRLRDVLRPAFSPRQANRYRQVMREEITRRLDEWAPRGAFDFEEFSSHFPISVMCRMLGADPSVVPTLRASLEAMGLAMSMDRKYLPEIQRAVGLLNDFAHGLVAERRARGNVGGEPDLLDLVIDACDSGTMSDDELHNLIIFMLIGGYDTSKNVLTLIMHDLIDRPDLYQRCAEDAAYCGRVINETFRFHGPATAMRKVIAPFDYRDVHFPEGVIVGFPWSMSGRDETAVPDPHVYNPDRTDGQHSHFGFGLGAHMCLGQHIARAQLEEGLHIVTKRLRNPRRDGPMGWRPFPGTWGIAGLPIRFEDAGPF